MTALFNSSLEGMYKMRELIGQIGIEGIRDMSIRDIENYICEHTAKLDFFYMNHFCDRDRESFKRAFVRELNAAIFHIYY